MKNNETNLTENSFYNLQNIYEVILELGAGNFTLEELVFTVDSLFSDLSKKEKKELCLKTLEVIKIIN